jgi:hypothetical protein
MSKSLCFAVLGAAMAWGANACLAAEASSPVQSPVQAPLKAPAAPAAPAAPIAPAPPAAARADSGYRTFSYEPGMTTRSYGRSRVRSPGFLDARTKALGRY